MGLISTPEETGVYGVAVRFFLLMGLPFHAGAVFLSQRASKLNALGDIKGLERLVERAAVRTILSSAALAIPSTLFAIFAADILGTGFASAGAIILVLVWARVGLSLFGEPSALLAATQHVGRVSIAMALAAILNIVLNLLLITSLGAMGAAIATAISYGFLTLVLAWSVRSVLGIRTFYGASLLRFMNGSKS